MRVTCEEGCGCGRHNTKHRYPPDWGERISLAKREAYAKYLEKVKAQLERRIRRRMEKMKQARGAQEEAR